ncbi:energy transducer TonB [Polynucleobacter paneuropaeus]|nr:energy transducer TonB [Polynucleobacter paneuropaeus]
MRFASLYALGYSPHKNSPSDVLSKCWRIAFIVLAVHYLVFILLSLKHELNIPLAEDELIIQVNPPIVTPEIALEKINTEPLEKQQSSKRPSESIAKVNSIEPIQAPQALDNTPIVKFNEGVIKPNNKPVKVEQREDRQVQAPIVERIEEKRIPELLQLKNPAPIEVKAATAQEELASNVLPVLVDKRNKDKDAPEVPPPGKAGNSSLAPASDSAKSSNIASATSSASSSGSSSNSPAMSPQAAASSNGAGTEMQAQISNTKSSVSGFSAGSGTADADYKSESLRNAQPRYPIYSRKTHQEGVVVVLAEVLTDGSATDIRIAASSGFKLLDEAALETVKQWRFIPAKRDGVPYAQRLRIPVTFSLNNR